MSTEWVFDGAETRFSFPHDVDANAIFIQGTYRYVYSNGDEGQWEDCSSNAPVINACSVEDWVRIEFDLELFVEDKDRHRRLVMHENDPALRVCSDQHHFIIWNNIPVAHILERGRRARWCKPEVKIERKTMQENPPSRALCWESRWGEESATVRHDEGGASSQLVPHSRFVLTHLNRCQGVTSLTLGRISVTSIAMP